MRSNANIVSACPIDPVATAMAKLLPILPAGSTNGSVTYGTPLQQNFDEYIARFDQVLPWRRIGSLAASTSTSTITRQPMTARICSRQGPGSTVQSQNWAVGYTKIISPNLVNNIVLDAVRSASDRGQQGGPGGTVPDMSDLRFKHLAIAQGAERHPQLRRLRRLYHRQLH